MRLNKYSQPPTSFDRQPALSETMTCVGWWPAKLHVYVMLSPRTMAAGLTLRAAVHTYGGGGCGGEGEGCSGQGSGCWPA